MVNLYPITINILGKLKYYQYIQFNLRLLTLLTKVNKHFIYNNNHCSYINSRFRYIQQYFNRLNIINIVSMLTVLYYYCIRFFLQHYNLI
jgi:hypothetical protein